MYFLASYHYPIIADNQQASIPPAGKDRSHSIIWNRNLGTFLVDCNNNSYMSIQQEYMFSGRTLSLKNFFLFPQQNQFSHLDYWHWRQDIIAHTTCISPMLILKFIGQNKKRMFSTTINKNHLITYLFCVNTLFIRNLSIFISLIVFAATRKGIFKLSWTSVIPFSSFAVYLIVHFEFLMPRDILLIEHTASLFCCFKKLQVP